MGTAFKLLEDLNLKFLQQVEFYRSTGEAEWQRGVSPAQDDR